jgi:hypothetical protein
VVRRSGSDGLTLLRWRVGWAAEDVKTWCRGTGVPARFPLKAAKIGHFGFTQRQAPKPVTLFFHTLVRPPLAEKELPIPQNLMSLGSFEKGNHDYYAKYFSYRKQANRVPR